MENTKRLMDFIAQSPDAYHAVQNLSKKLEDNGFTKLSESEEWNIQGGGKYFVTRNGSSLISFKVPENGCRAFLICAAHTDSPTFKLKSNFESDESGMIRLNIEGYGGMIRHTWFDRPLSVSGRVVTVKENRVCTRLVNIDRDLVIIPSLAIHMDGSVNKGREFNVQSDMRPLAGEIAGGVVALAARYAGINEEDIVSCDLMLYNRMKGTFIGTDNEFFSAPRIDDLQCVFAAAEGFLSSEVSNSVQVFAAFDNEEVGSGTKQGARSTFLRDVLERVEKDGYRKMLSQSFMLSCDNAHALHMNYPAKSDDGNRVYMNGGIVIKRNANERYTTDAVSEAVVKTICEKNNIPYQLYANRSDIAGGSTLGNLSNEKVSVNTADIGLAQLAMHSAYETAGSRDTKYMIDFIKAFYGSNFKF